MVFNIYGLFNLVVVYRYDVAGRITNYQEFGGEDANLVEVSDKVLLVVDQHKPNHLIITSANHQLTYLTNIP